MLRLSLYSAQYSALNINYLALSFTSSFRDAWSRRHRMQHN